jgi:hypothetical protein
MGRHRTSGLYAVVVLQNRPPGFVDGVSIRHESLVHFINKPLVGAELIGGTILGESGGLAGHA